MPGNAGLLGKLLVQEAGSSRDIWFMLSLAGSCRWSWGTMESGLWHTRVTTGKPPPFLARMDWQSRRGEGAQTPQYRQSPALSLWAHSVGELMVWPFCRGSSLGVQGEPRPGLLQGKEKVEGPIGQQGLVRVGRARRLTAETLRDHYSLFKVVCFLCHLCFLCHFIQNFCLS